ncbi:MAG: patatin-like phospholipase family protein [Gemmatimonadota bacterium]
MNETGPNDSPRHGGPTSGSGRWGTPEGKAGSLGNRIWLALGGGGLKGLAHIGAWRAVNETGVRISGLVGTSIGSLVGVLAASGVGWEEMRDMALELRREDIVRVNRRAVLFNGIRQVSVFRGDILREYYQRILPPLGWDALGMPVLVNAVDLATGRTQWFGPGARLDVSLLDAVYASSALPLFYPPAVIDGRAFVDGGTEHPLGLFQAAHMGATGIIGVDVGAGEEGKTERILRQGMLAVHQRIFSIMTYRRRRDLIAQWTDPPLLYVRPQLDGYETFDFDSVEYFMEEGYRATMEVLMLHKRESGDSGAGGA